MLPSNPTPSAYWPNALQSSPDNSPLRPQFQHLTQKPLSNNNLNTSIPSDPLNHQNSSLNDSSINPSPTPSPASVNLTLDDPSQTLLNSTWEGVSNSPPQQNQSIIHDPNDDSSSGLKIPPVALGGAIVAGVLFLLIIGFVLMKNIKGKKYKVKDGKET